MTPFRISSDYSIRVLSGLREELGLSTRPDGEIIITCGSYSRREASPQSDLDYFVVMPEGDTGKPKTDSARASFIEETISKAVSKPPATGGAFANCHTCEEILANIGGDSDGNKNLTRRILLLLEGDWLAGESAFKGLRRAILEKYISQNINDHQLSLFLLNDVIRYYRTVTVDYEFKVFQATPAKPWGVRYIKLIFSRKLLYASGLFSVALTADRRRDRKIDILEDMLSLSCLDRIRNICGASRTEKLASTYERFLEFMSIDKNRAYLDSLKPEERSTDPIFRDLKSEGHTFTRELLSLFETTFDTTHPIRRAVVL